MRIKIIVVCLIFFTSRAVAITVPELVENMLSNHPLQYQMAEGAYQKEQSISKARAAFDPTFSQQTQFRPGGYYDGRFANQQWQSPLRAINGHWYSEYRIADGSFPVYEQQYDTLSGGEVAVGISVPLLRDRSVDSRIVSVENARLDAREWQATQQLTINALLYEGIIHYLSWLEAHVALAAVRDLTTALEQQVESVKVQIAKGDVPRLAMTELQQSVLSLKSREIELKFRRSSSAQALSYYWRDSNGVPVVPELSERQSVNLSLNFEWPFSITTDSELANLRASVREHPVLKQFAAAKVQLQNTIRLSKNALKPRLDLKAEIARDMGAGPTSLDSTESKLALSFTYPIGNTRAKAERAIAASEFRELAFEARLAGEQLIQQFDLAVLALKEARQSLELATEAERVVRELSEGERQRFAAGDTDWFALNARENKLAEAVMKRLKLQFTVHRKELHIYRITSLISERFN